MSDIVERRREYPKPEYCNDIFRKTSEDIHAAADIMTALRAELERKDAALEVCDRVLHFDLRKMITWGPDYNQAVKDAADAARAALSPAQKEKTDDHA